MQDLVEHMQRDVLEQQHLEMKWTNKYDLKRWNDLLHEINSYSFEVEPTSNGNKIFSEGLKMFNQALFKHYAKD